MRAHGREYGERKRELICKGNVHDEEGLRLLEWGWKGEPKDPVKLLFCRDLLQAMPHSSKERM